MELGYKINESTIRSDGVHEIKSATLFELSTTETEELEFIRRQKEMVNAIIDAFDISPLLLGVADSNIVEGTIQPVPLALPQGSSKAEKCND